MGIEYELVDTKARTAYELGKGLWFELPHVDHRIAETTWDEWLAAFGRVWAYGDEKPAELTPYLLEIARESFDFCVAAGWGVELRRDSRDYNDEEWGPDGTRILPRVVGSRYRDD